MSSLTETLRDRIVAHGPLTFAAFMEAALYDPQHGYYASGRAETGARGDFFTSVSVGPLFGRLLARQFQEMWSRLGEPARFTIVEQGAHDGALAADVLLGLQELAPTCFPAVEYMIVEPTPIWRERQTARLAPWPNVRWTHSLEEMGEIEGVFFSNELIDAFPAHRVRKSAEGWRELHVGWNESFVWIEGPLSSAEVRAAIEHLPEPLPDGYETEVRPHAGTWIGEVARALARGWVLVIDYGYERAEYYLPERSGGTLSAYAAHRRIDNPLALPGECDLTAHVDFTALAEAGTAAGLRVRGFTDQQRFISGLGLLHFPDAHEITAERAKELREFKTLMHPQFLGAAFRVLCLEKGVEGALAGFRFGGAA